MIKNLECDKCHKVYRPYTISDTENKFAFVEISEDEIINKDLCKDCYNELINWFNS